MSNKVDPHVDEEVIEKYSRGELPARKVAGVEEHFLICGPCRQSLQSSEAYLAAMRQAAAKLRRGEKKPKSKVARKAGSHR